MKKKIILFKFVLLLSFLFLTNLKAELNNKVIISVGNEIITNYDLSREIKYLNIITSGRFKNLDSKDIKNIAIDSLIKDKIKVNAFSNYNNIVVNSELIDNQLGQTSNNIGFNNLEDLETFLIMEEYSIKELREKITLELKWNQLIYQFYKNQIVIDKEKIDQKLKEFVSKE